MRGLGLGKKMDKRNNVIISIPQNKQVKYHFLNNYFAICI